MKGLMLILFAVASCGSQNNISGNDRDLFMQIDFQNLFDKDIASLSVNECLILEKQLLKSDKIDGVTSVSLELKRDQNNFLIVNGHKKECKVNAKNLYLEVVLNDRTSTFDIDLNKGKYIGFDKGQNNKVELNQSKYPFEYD